MTNPATNPQGAAPIEPEAEEVETNVVDQPELDPETGQPVTPPDDTDEIEHEGVKHRIPKALKGAFLMQSDYTRKTQEVAEQRRQLEERQTAFTQQEASQREFMTDVARVTALSDQLKAFEKFDWAAYRQTNPNEAQDLWFHYMQLRDARDNAAGELQTKVNKRNSESAAATAKRLEEGRAILQRDIPNWSPDLAGKLTDFGVRELGFTQQEIAAISDPRLIKVLHRAYQGDQVIKKAAAAKAAEDKLKAQEGVQPAPKVGARASSGTIQADSPASDKLSGDEWLKRRNEQLRKRA